jgi:hypothetical protein
LVIAVECKFSVEGFEKKGEPVGCILRTKMRGYRNNTMASPESAEDKRGWTTSRAISTRRRQFKAKITSRRRAATRVVPSNQPLVGARICDNIKLRRHACRKTKLGMTRFPFPVCLLSLKQ